MAKHVVWRNMKRDYFARIDDGDEFYIGTRVSYGGRIGLQNGKPRSGLVYKAEDFRATYGFWADFIEPTGICESQSSYICLNTYDRARFTFGFLQYAALVPDGDFVTWMRGILQRPQTVEWFPDLQVRNGRIAKETLQGPVQLEDSQSTGKLMDFLNPGEQSVDDAEIVNSAKLIGWHTEAADLAQQQISVGVDLFKSAMKLYSKKYNLDGIDDHLCVVVADIRHQGRGTSAEIIAALHEKDKYAALLRIGAASYKERCDELKRQVDRRLKAGVFGKMVYDQRSGDFIAKAPIA